MSSIPRSPTGPKVHLTPASSSSSTQSKKSVHKPIESAQKALTSEQGKRSADRSFTATAGPSSSSSGQVPAVAVKGHEERQQSLTKGLLNGTVENSPEWKALPPERQNQKLGDAEEQTAFPGCKYIRGVCGVPKDPDETVLSRDCVDFAGAFKWKLKDGRVATVHYAIDGTDHALEPGKRQELYDARVAPFVISIRDWLMKVDPKSFNEKNINTAFSSFAKEEGMFVVTVDDQSYFMPHCDGGIVVIPPPETLEDEFEMTESGPSSSNAPVRETSVQEGEKLSVIFDCGGKTNKSIVTKHTPPGTQIIVMTDGITDACEAHPIDRYVDNLVDKGIDFSPVYRDVEKDLRNRERLVTNENVSKELRKIAYEGLFTDPKVYGRCLKLKKLAIDINQTESALVEWRKWYASESSKLNELSATLSVKKMDLKSAGRLDFSKRKQLQQEIAHLEFTIKTAHEQIEKKKPDLKKLEDKVFVYNNIRNEIKEKIKEMLNGNKLYLGDIAISATEFKRVEGVARSIMFEIGFESLYGDKEKTPRELVEGALPYSNDDKAVVCNTL